MLADTAVAVRDVAAPMIGVLVPCFIMVDLGKEM